MEHTTFYNCNIEKTHPGARKELDWEEKGISACWNNLNIRQSTDGAGESTFTKTSKNADSIKNFPTNDSTNEKWVLWRLAQAEYVPELLRVTGLSSSQEMFETKRNIQIWINCGKDHGGAESYVCKSLWWRHWQKWLIQLSIWVSEGVSLVPTPILWGNPNSTTFCIQC